MDRTKEPGVCEEEKVREARPTAKQVERGGLCKEKDEERRGCRGMKMTKRLQRMHR